MEAPEYFHGGYCRDGNLQCTPEKQVKAGGGGGGGDHFIVEDLLDFSNEEDDDAAGGLDGGAFDATAGNSTDSSTVTAVDSCSNSFSGPDTNFSGNLACRSLVDASLSGELCVPYDEVAELEWLSNFVEESFSSEDLEKLQLISGLKASSTSSSETRGDISAAAAARNAQQTPVFRQEGPVPGKARSKRSRAAPCSWSSRLLVVSPTPLSEAPWSLSDILAPSSNPCRKAPKPAKKKDLPAGPTLAPSDGRKCLHCATDKTPQWRTGPMGPKTLCNACGVRYKSGRLVPEYRPAASPTFMLSKHSNSHRKVLELRRQKEVMQQQPAQFLHPSLYEGPGTESAVDDFLIHHHIGPDFRQLI